MGPAFFRAILATLLFSLMAPANGLAQNFQSLTEGQLTFASSFVAASRQSSMEEFWSLVHPRAQKCQTLEHRELLELQIYQQLVNKPVPEKYTVKVAPVAAGSAKDFYESRYGKGVEVPVLPEYALVIEYHEPRGACDPRPMTRIVYIAPEGGRWYETLACPRKLYLHKDKLQMLMSQKETQAELVITMVSPKEKKRLNEMIFQDRQLNLAAQYLIRHKNVKPEIAAVVIDKICKEGDIP